MQYGQVLTYGVWTIPYKAINVLCPDGKRRTCKIIGQPDTYFSQPASVQAYGKTVAGYITGIETDDNRDLEFRPYLYRKNHTVFNKDK